MRSVWVGLGGFAGAIARYHVDGLISRRTTGQFPWGTFAVNLSGCLLLGVLVSLLAERFVSYAGLRTALTVGFVGAYTTFSTFALETFRLGDERAMALAGVNVVASVVLGLFAVWIGLTLGRAI